MAKKIDEILSQVLKKVEPQKEDLKLINKSLKEFLKKIEERKKKCKINADIFIGGSYAKNTMIKKDKYDIDILLRFDKKHEKEDISKLTEKMLKGVRGVSKIHGSRDYFRIIISDNLFFEVVPVLKVRTPKESKNITDLSYSHVKYINRKVKNKKVLKEIKIAKAFCYAKNCYGAESYINGFSGYALELLIYNYGSFLKFIKTVIKIKEQEIIDIEKLHKTKKNILLDLNSSKLGSPIILIDPTYKQRNALAALSKETFEQFQINCRNFLKTPLIKEFELKKIDVESLNKKRKNSEFIVLKAKTNRQEGDIAGSKLFKFYKYLAQEIEKFFEIKQKEFEYTGKKSADYFFVVKRRKELIYNGPFIKDKHNVELFKRKHKNTFVKSGRIYAREKIEFEIKEFINNWKDDYKREIKDMGILGLGIV